MRTIIRYRKIVWVFILLLILTGVFTYFQLPKRELPEINVNLASISTVFPGASPEEVEGMITNPLEERLLDINGIEKVTSASTTGFSSITATISDKADTSSVQSKIRQTITDVSRSFPEGVQDPEVDTDLRGSAVASYHLTASNYDNLQQLHGTIDDWKSTLTSIPEVKSVLVKGLPDPEVRLTLNNQQLNEAKLSSFSVLEAVRKELSPAAIGTEKQDNTSYQLELNKYKELDELIKTPVGQSSTGVPITLSDVGTIEIVNQEVKDLIASNGKPALSLTVFAKEGADISKLQNQLTEHIKDHENTLPSGVKIDRFYTQSTIIEEVFTSLITSFGISLAAVLIIIMLGLPFLSALLVGLAVPISIVIGLIPLPYAGVDLNQISIIGMIIAIGILVDDAIVVNDNIQRRFQLGDSALEGTIRGVKEVSVSIITSTLMIIFSFFPLTFLSGSNGEFIRALPTVLIMTILASTIMALTLIPTVQYVRKKYSKKVSKKKVGLLGGSFHRLEKTYADILLPKVTKWPWITGIAGLLVCLLLSLLVFKIPFEFFPPADRQEVTVSVKYPQGTPLKETKDQLDLMKSFLKDNESDITETAVYTGSGLPNLFSSSLKRSGENTGQLLVRIDKEDTSATEFMNEWETKLRNKFQNAEIFMDTIVSGPPPSPPIELKIQGTDLKKLVDISQQFKEQMENIKGAEIVTLNAGNGQPFLKYNIDRKLLAEKGIPIDQVSSQIQIANIGIPIGKYNNGGKQLPITAVVDDGDHNGINLQALKLASSNPGNSQGTPSFITLDELITVEQTELIGVIPHQDGERTITLEAYPKQNMSASFTRAANELISDAKEDLPDGYTLSKSGETNERTEFFIEASKIFVIVLFLIYMTIAIQFNSLTMPLLITSSVFLAITGAIIGLFLTGQPLSFLAVLGIVSLSGVAVRNSVIIIEFIEKNRSKYSTLKKAVVEAGRARLRPIILTSLTSIAALLPIIFTGDVLFRPLAISIVSGLIFSTVLTLLLVPAFYLILKKGIRKV
ncbi:efflux RND transporter permease subunit [Thalassobacillus pellis]|uniref:efflux RND transporter permease subunit n=1 Tax=Thalassobacillus pellis TaxID=748008 RepID=UPI0019606DA4|nr:efflux RND transporter permease subunit [Thalassobacillus pellis]MBM7552509.1 multidrug efflux pump subunit AcrB [Thalassobacillus pellis]